MSRKSKYSKFRQNLTVIYTQSHMRHSVIIKSSSLKSMQSNFHPNQGSFAIDQLLWSCSTTSYHDWRRFCQHRLSNCGLYHGRNQASFDQLQLHLLRGAMLHHSCCTCCRSGLFDSIPGNRLEVLVGFWKLLGNYSRKQK